jgi:S1-C subfamily serine protease
VQKTIETVVPDTKQKVQTIVIKEQDLIVDAIDRNSKSVVKIKKNGENVGFGLFVSKDGIVIADSRYIDAKEGYSIGYADLDLKADIIDSDPQGFSLLKISATELAKVKTLNFSILGDSDALKPGQSIVALSTETGNVLQGIFSGFYDKKAVLPVDITTIPTTIDITTGTATTTTATTATTAATVVTPVDVFKLLNLSINLSKSYSSSPIIDIDGNVIGFSILKAEEIQVLPSNIVKDAIIKASKQSI